MSLSNEANAKLRAMIRRAKNAYRDTSILEDAVTIQDYTPDMGAQDFFQLPYRVMMERDWFTDPSYVPDLVFGEIGRGIAFSEMRLLTEELGRLSTADRSRTPLISVLTKISELIQAGYRPSVLFAPIDHYMEAYTTWLGPQMRIRNDERGHPHLELGGQARLRIVWSNKLVPFSDFFVVDKGWARWVVKQRFSVKVTPNEHLDTIFKTVYRLDMAEGGTSVRRIAADPT